MIPNICSIWIEWVVGTMIMYCESEVICFYLLLNIWEKIIIWSADDQFNSCHFCIFKGLINSFLRLHINNSDSVNIYPAGFEFGQNFINLFPGTIHWHMKIFQRKILNPYPVHHFDGLLNGKIHKGIT